MMSRTRTRRHVVAASLLVWGCLTLACKEKTPCDDDQVLLDSYCRYVDAAATGDDAATPIGEAEAGGGEAGQTGGEEVGGATGMPAFGRACATDADCAVPAGLCAPQLFYCTALACDVNPSLCPAGWTCLDVSAYAGHPETMCFRGL